MKINELNNGDEFGIDFYNPETEEIAITLSGKFIKMDGAYAQVQFFGEDEISLLHCGTEVRKTEFCRCRDAGVIPCGTCDKGKE